MFLHTTLLEVRLCLVALLVLGACSAPQNQRIYEVLTPCLSDDGPADGYCGTFSVAENRSEPGGQRIDLKVIVLPAFNAEPAPDPVFLLAGGPGQGAASVASRLDVLFDGIRRERDVVFVDQRGTGESNALRCDFYEGQPEFVEPPPLTEEDVQACLDRLPGDPRFYTTPIAMDDLDEVRAWLGYEQINPLGGSYGTRAALVYLRRHPEHVNAVILDGVAPPDMSLPLYFPRDAQRALDRLTNACAASQTCSEMYPDLEQNLDALLRDLEASPRRAAIRHPRTGQSEEALISRRMAALVLTSALYSPWTSSLAPLAITRAAQGDFGPLMALTSGNEGLQEEIADGMFFAVTCSEDYPRLTDELVDAESAGTFAGRDILETRWQACRFWPRGEIAASYYEPVQSDKPVLIFSGEVDPVTPPSWGERVAEHMPNSRHLIARGTGHGVVTSVGCAMRLVRQFLDEGSTEALDPSCLEGQVRPPFFLNYAGPYLVDQEDGAH